MTDKDPYDIPQELDQLSVIEGELRSAAIEIMVADGDRFFPMDFFSNAAINRSLFLSSGIRDMVNSRNLVCVGALLRLQLDTAIRYAAATLVDDPHKFATDVLNGEQIRTMKDRAGVRMTDRHLVDTFSELADWLPGVYERTSGYIHFSSVHIHHTLKLGRNDRTLEVTVGCEVPPTYDSLISEALAAFNACGRMLLFYLAGWCRTKIDGGVDRNADE